MRGVGFSSFSSGITATPEKSWGYVCCLPKKIAWVNDLKKNKNHQ